jgi:integrator complex subunit 6
VVSTLSNGHIDFFNYLGRSFLINSQRALQQCLESLVQKIQIGVVVNLEKVMSEGDSERSAWHTCRKMIMIPRSLPKTEKTEYNWPIPEDYWPTAATLSLPPRSAHALIKFQTTPCLPVTDKFPFDKYELEPSPLTQYILERRQPTMAWPVC